VRHADGAGLLSARRASRLVALAAAAFCSTAHCLAEPDLGALTRLAKVRYGVDAGETVALWQDLIVSSRNLSEQQKLEAVNAFFNRNVGFADDGLTWRTQDYWATPLETLGRAQGDCEDFSIGKYVTLGLLGVPIERLRITYVRAEAGLPGRGISQAHMVLAYYPQPDAEPLILDNLISELRPASRRPDLHPVFAFNSYGLWVGDSSTPAVTDPTAPLSRWRDLLRRMAEEGLD
jgi:predicted transglutaminase-like cysteine proteinase